MEIRIPSGRSAALCQGASLGIASTTRTGLLVALEYCSSPRETTSESVSVIQSRPVMPRSNRPCSTYSGISCGRRNRTRSMPGWSIEAW